jgi:hypothetical protein
MEPMAAELWLINLFIILAILMDGIIRSRSKGDSRSR